MSQHLAGPDPAQNLSDDVIALLRTIVPVLWGFVASWLIGLGLPVVAVTSVHGVAIAALTAVLTAAWYALWKWLSPHIPLWLVTVLLGYAANPTYTTIPSGHSGPGTAPSPAPGPPSTIPRPRGE